MTNKLAGYDGYGNPNGAVQLVPARPYDYNLPPSARTEVIVVKAISSFNHRQPARSSVELEVDPSGLLPLPIVRLRSSVPPGIMPVAGVAPQVFSSRMPYIIRPMLRMPITPLTPSRKRKAEWSPQPGCLCIDEQAHTKHLQRCRKWWCACQPKLGAYGGKTVHHPDCLRKRFQRHAELLRAPVKGDKLQMIGEARRVGCPDVMFGGRSWVTDPQGRPTMRSAWMTTG